MSTERRIATNMLAEVPQQAPTRRKAIAGRTALHRRKADVGLAVHDEGEDAVAAAELAEVADFLVHVARAGEARGGDDDEEAGARECVAVSSLAIGGDLIFAEECLRAGIAFRAILPFEALEFLKDDFTAEDRARFEHCLGAACAVEVAPIAVSSVEAKPGDAEAESNTVNRKNAYLDCGYRVVENSDVVLFLWDGVRGGVGGSADAWSYAETLKKPVWCWNPQTGQDERLRWPGVTGHTRERKRLFHDRLLFDLFAANNTSPTAAAVSKDTARQSAVRARFNRLDQFALQEQEKTKVGLQRGHWIARARITQIGG